MSNLKTYIEGDPSDKEFEKISEQLIQVKRDRDQRKMWEKTLREQYGVEKDKSNPKSFFSHRPRLFLLTIAATLLFLISFFLIVPSFSSPAYLQAVNNHIDHLSIMADQSFLRKGEQQIDSLRSQATLAYVNKAFEKSIPFWEQAIESSQAKGTDYFYLALCQLQKGTAEPDKTIDLLLRSKNMDGPEEEINWALALAYLKRGDMDQGKEILGMIVEKKAYQSKAAEELLGLMKD